MILVNVPKRSLD